MPELIDKIEALGKLQTIGIRKAYKAIERMPAIEAEPVRHGRWIKCDYKHLEHGFMKTEPNAGLCCSNCRTAFKKKNMTYKQYCAACGAKMDLRTPTEVQLDEADDVMMGGTKSG